MLEHKKDQVSVMGRYGSLGLTGSRLHFRLKLGWRLSVWARVPQGHIPVLAELHEHSGGSFPHAAAAGVFCMYDHAELCRKKEAVNCLCRHDHSFLQHGYALTRSAKCFYVLRINRQLLSQIFKNGSMIFPSYKVKPYLLQKTWE